MRDRAIIPAQVGTPAEDADPKASAITAVVSHGQAFTPSAMEHAALAPFDDVNLLRRRLAA